MYKYMFDMNIVIYVIKCWFIEVLGWFNVNVGRMVIFFIILVELLYGVEKSVVFECNLSVVEDFVLCFIVLDYDDKVVIYYGFICVSLE